MSNFLITKTFNSITKILKQCHQINNLTLIDNLHAHLITTGLLLSASPHIHTKLIITCITKQPIKNNLKTLSNCLNLLNLNNPLPFNLLISDFCKNGFPVYALKTLSFMHLNCVSLDTYALCSSLVASSRIKNVNFGKEIHAYVIKLGYLSSVFVGSALVDLYAKLSFVNGASKVFDEMPVRNTVCANALLAGFVESKLWDQGVRLIKEMAFLNLSYDRITLLAMLRVCAGLSAIDFGKQVHNYLIRKIYGMENDFFLQSSLIEMYGRCGYVREAMQVFNLAGFRIAQHRSGDIVLWTSMLSVCGRNGYFNEVVALFKEMLKEGIRPDGVAFLTVISACGHTGQVQLGIEYFESMSQDYYINPDPEHYSCVIDLFCRAGELDRAWKLVNEMIAKGYKSFSISMWGALLNACEEHGNIELGKLAAQEALKMEPHNAGIYVMLSNLYARFNLWDEIDELREIMKDIGLKKDVGCSWIEVTR